MGVILIPIQVFSFSHSHYHDWLDFCPIPMGFPFPMEIPFPRSSLLEGPSSLYGCYYATVKTHSKLVQDFVVVTTTSRSLVVAVALSS